MDLDSAEQSVGLGMEFVDMGHSPMTHNLTSCQGHLRLVLTCCWNNSMKLGGEMVAYYKIGAHAIITLAKY